MFTQTVRGATSVAVTPALASSTTYFWRVTSANACGAGAASAVFTFRTSSAPGDCKAPTQPTVVFQDDVENGVNGWTTTGSTGSATWAISTARANSATHAWYAEDLGAIGDQRLISPAIALPIDQSPLTLAFANWRQIEAQDPGCYDGAIIEASTDGSTFTPLPDSAIISGGAYDGTVSDQFNNPLAGISAWCTDTARPFTEGPVRVDVTNYAGQTVQFRFRLGSDSSVGEEGWYVDDISVTSCSGGSDVIFANGFDPATP